MMRRTFARTTLAGLAFATLLTAGCQQAQEMTAKRTEFRATLNGASEVPPNGSAGKGELEASYNPVSRDLEWRLRFSDLSGPVTGAHFHGPAGPGANAGIAVPITGTFVGTWQRGEAKLTDAQAADLMAGRWYVNIHTARVPAGEIRGQVLPSR